MLPRFCCAAVMLGASLASAVPAERASLAKTTEPPSSISPKPSGKLKFSHEHRRVLSCSAERSGPNPSCREKRADADSATSLVLRPIAPPRLPAKLKRQSVTVSFGSQVGRQEKDVELGAGDWQIEWPGYEHRPTFKVEPGDGFEIKLRSRSGACKKAGPECVLSTAGTAKECTIPDQRRSG
jgi:hypothetical protein